MAKTASKRRAWTAANVRELKTLARKKTPVARIARNLKRSEGATRQKAFNLGLLHIRHTGRGLDASVQGTPDRQGYTNPTDRGRALCRVERRQR